MVSWLRPLSVKLVFEDRYHKLGDTIDLVAEIDANSYAESREAGQPGLRVTMNCEITSDDARSRSTTIHIYPSL